MHRISNTLYVKRFVNTVGIYQLSVFATKIYNISRRPLPDFN